MPRIPDSSSLGYSVPQARTPRFQDRSGQIVGDATARLAGTIGQAAEVLQEREDRFSYAQAKSALLQADIEARRSLENDQDWPTYEKRYTESMTKAREKAAGLIRGNRDRALFDMDAKLDVERGIGEIRGLSKRKEIDWGRASLDSTLEANRTAALNAKDEPTRAALIAATQEMIGGAKAKGYLSEQEAVNHQQAWTANYAESYVGMQPAEQRVAMLSKPKGTVADYIAPDRRVTLLEAAKKENRDLNVRRESQAQFDSIIAKHGGNWNAAIKAARAIDDPEVRDSTESRVNHERAIAKQNEMEFREALTDEAMTFINEGGKFADLPLKIKNGLKPSELNSLRSYAEQMAGGGPRHTDPETLIELSRLSAEDPQKFGELNLLEYRPKLTDQDFEQYVDLQRKIKTGVLDGKATGFMSVNQIRDQRLAELFGSARPLLKESEKQKQRRRQFIEQYEGRLKAFREDNKRAAGADDARKILDDMTAEVAIDRDFWFDTKKPAYELTQDDIPEVPDADRNEIIRELQKRGKRVTEQSIVDLYKRVNSK